MSRTPQRRGAPIARGSAPLVCVPLVGATRDALLHEARLVAEKRPDVVEWRVDFFEPIGRTEEVLDTGRALRSALEGTPLLFTCRSVKEGGRAVPLDEPGVVDLHDAVCASGCIDLVDYELSNAPANRERVRAQARRAGIQLVLSFHDFAATPGRDALVQTFTSMARAGADVAKIAVTPRSRDDVLTLLAATSDAERLLDLPLISISMGPLGAVTRVCGWLFGSALTFAVGVGSSAPGQLPIDELRASIDVLRRAIGDTDDQ